LEKFDFDFLDEKNGLNFKLLFLIFAVLSMAIYIGYLIYGDKGLNRMIDINNQKKVLEENVKKLRKENVKLQKEYFGLKDIEGD
jgi:cell division protein FtsB